MYIYVYILKVEKGLGYRSAIEYASEPWGYCDTTQKKRVYTVCICGILFILVILMQIIVLIFVLAAAEDNPFTDLNNNQMFACLPGYISQNIGLYREEYSIGLFLTATALFISTVWGIIFIANINRQANASIDPIFDNYGVSSPNSAGNRIRVSTLKFTMFNT